MTLPYRSLRFVAVLAIGVVFCGVRPNSIHAQDFGPQGRNGNGFRRQGGGGGDEGAASKEVAKRYMQKYDANSDGLLRADEAKKFRFGNLMEADGDGNAVVSLEELEAWSASKRANVRQRNESNQDEGNGGGRGGENGPPGGAPPSPPAPAAATDGSASTSGSSSPPPGESPPANAATPQADGSAKPGSTPAAPPVQPGGGSSPAATPTASPPATPTASARVGSTVSGITFQGKKSYRLRTAHERMPSGVPSWFFEKDVNGDGQVMMSEWTSSWSEEKASAFNAKDVNGDGVITPKEAIKRG